LVFGAGWRGHAAANVSKLPPRERVATVHQAPRCNARSHGICCRICCPRGAIPTRRLGFKSSDEHVRLPRYPRAAWPMLLFPPTRHLSSCCSVGEISCSPQLCGSSPLVWSDCNCGETTACRKLCSGFQGSSWGTHFNSRGHARACIMMLNHVFCAHAATTHAPRCANRLGTDNGNDDLLNFVMTLPEKEVWLRCECARKRTADDTFVTRRCVRAHIHTHVRAQRAPQRMRVRPSPCNSRHACSQTRHHGSIAFFCARK